MPLSPFNRTPAGRRLAAGLIAAGLASLVLAACNTTSTTPGSGRTIFGAAAPAAPKKVYTAADFSPDTYCPPVRVRVGTEALAIYDHSHESDPDFVRYQASINKTARECHLNGDTLSIKIGVAGDVVGGPKGSSGPLTLPIRVAVTRQLEEAKPLFSQLFKQPTSLTAPEFRADFSLVQEISFKVAPDDHDLIVYVGFDEGPGKGPAKKS